MLTPTFGFASWTKTVAFRSGFPSGVVTMPVTAAFRVVAATSNKETVNRLRMPIRRSLHKMVSTDSTAQPASHTRHQHDRLRNRVLVLRAQCVFPLQIPRGGLAITLWRAGKIQLAD